VALVAAAVAHHALTRVLLPDLPQETFHVSWATATPCMRHAAAPGY
jgi:hypothetical protein